MTAIQIDESGQELTPAFFRRRGLRAAVDAQVLLRTGGADGHALARRAISDLVEAFLHDRAGNADLFARAHQLGSIISEQGACRWTPGPETYTLRCPIFALHQTWATSVAMTETTRCSICGAGDFGCDHLPGEAYEGEECVSIVESIGSGGHFALTADPDFTYTWHREQEVATARIVADGRIKRAGDRAFCQHCQDCEGIRGPSAGDLDPVGRLRAMRERRPGSETGPP